MVETNQPLIYLNGAFIPPEQGQVSVMDRGFLFGDGVYEVIPCYAGRLFRLAHHLQRLDNSLQAIRMQNPLSHEQWQRVLERLVGQLPGEDQSVYLQITRGATGKRDHAIPGRVTPTLFCMTERAVYPDPATLARGVSAVTLADIRWQRCDIKATTLLANVLLRSEANDRGAAEAILIRDGMAIEGSTSNLFVVRDGLIITPPKGDHLLPGITRDLVLELAAQHGLAYQEQAISLQQLQEAEEIWVTSSTKEITAVVELDDKPVGMGKPGPIYERMIQYYRDYKNQLRAGRADT